MIRKKTTQNPSGNKSLDQSNEKARILQEGKNKRDQNAAKTAEASPMSSSESIGFTFGSAPKKPDDLTFNFGDSTTTLFFDNACATTRESRIDLNEETKLKGCATADVATNKKLPDKDVKDVKGSLFGDQSDDKDRVTIKDGSTLLSTPQKEVNPFQPNDLLNDFDYTNSHTWATLSRTIVKSKRSIKELNMNQSDDGTLECVGGPINSGENDMDFSEMTSLYDKHAIVPSTRNSLGQYEEDIDDSVMSLLSRYTGLSYLRNPFDLNRLSVASPSDTLIGVWDKFENFMVASRVIPHGNGKLLTTDDKVIYVGNFKNGTL